MYVAGFAPKQNADELLQFREQRMRFVSALIALATSTISALADEDTSRVTIAEHEGSRFYTELTVQKCTLTKEQWEKQEDSSRILWHYAEIDLEGARLFHPMEAMSAEIQAELAAAGKPIPESKVIDARDLDDPYVSFMISTREGWSGQQEYWHKRKAAQSAIEKGKAVWSDRNSGNTHLVFSSKGLLVLFRGEDTYAKTEAAALRIKAYIEEYCKFLG